MKFINKGDDPQSQKSGAEEVVFELLSAIEDAKTQKLYYEYGSSEQKFLYVTTMNPVNELPVLDVFKDSVITMSFKKDKKPIKFIVVEESPYTFSMDGKIELMESKFYNLYVDENRLEIIDPVTKKTEPLVIKDLDVLPKIPHILIRNKKPFDANEWVTKSVEEKLRFLSAKPSGPPQAYM